MDDRIQNIRREALAQITASGDLDEVERLRITYLGRRSELNLTLQGLKDVAKKKRAITGRLVNDAKNAIDKSLRDQEEKIVRDKTGIAWFDPTVPGEKPPLGHLHPITNAIEEISDIFQKIGFVRVRYPEVEWDWFAFESLNMPHGHPARDEWETFFVDAPPHKKYGEVVLTPHTSSGQVREMNRVKSPPIRMINIAKCYRRQSDVSHVPMFHQFEGLVVDKNISIINLKGALDYFAKSFFGTDLKTRLRPYHFQFTEPSFEVDITCKICKGAGCSLCGTTGWLELGGAGMVHPEVLKNGGISPQKYSGFAFGWGVERVLMMKTGIDDIRVLYGSDLRFLRQF